MTRVRKRLTGCDCFFYPRYFTATVPSSHQAECRANGFNCLSS